MKVWLDGCADPSKLALRGKTRAYLLNTTGHVDLTLRDLTLFGGTFAAPQADLRLERVQMLFPSANRRVLDDEGFSAAETVLDFNKAHGSLTMLNSSVAWADATPLFNRVGKSALVRDCRFSRIGYALGESATLSDGGQSSELVFEHNSVDMFNTFVAITPGLHATIQYNVFSRQTPSVDGVGSTAGAEPSPPLLSSTRTRR